MGWVGKLGFGWAIRPGGGSALLTPRVWRAARSRTTHREKMQGLVSASRAFLTEQGWRCGANGAGREGWHCSLTLLGRGCCGARGLVLAWDYAEIQSKAPSCFGLFLQVLKRQQRAQVPDTGIALSSDY